MNWKVEYTDEFDDWWRMLLEKEQDAIDRTIHLLEQFGPMLPFPMSSGIS